MISPDMNLSALSGLAQSLTSPATLPPLGRPPLSMSAPNDISRTLLGPTGNLFLGPTGNPSTHLNIVTEHPLLPGRQTMLPMLVPGQIQLDRLLSGQPATRAQYQRVQDWGRQQALMGQMLPTFDTIPEALQYEQDWRKDVIPQLEQQIGDPRRLFGLAP